jgi:hypothetical protein
MHLITGMLITALLKHRRKGGVPGAFSRRSPLLQAPSVLAVTHALPGRTRFRVPVLIGATEACGKLSAALAGVDGIGRVECSPISGSVLIEHDDARLKPDLLAAALVRLLGLEAQLTHDVEAALGREIRELARAANRAVYEQTGGLLDLKTALFCALAVLGVRKMVQQGTLALPAGFTLLWWAAHGLLRGRQATL